jgi:NAD+ kinase
VKLVDTKDLKSLPYGSASSSLAEGTIFMKNRFHFIFDKNIKSKKFKKFILKNNKQNKPNKADIIIVAGGDGFMLNNLKKYYKYQKPFYGVNCGTFGFLMNKLNFKNFKENIKKAKSTTINPLTLISINKKKIKKEIIAINEISLLRQSKQASSLKVKIGNKTIVRKLIGDGILISTPAGSTAYNLSVHGPILSLNSEKLAVTPISPFRPRRWKGKIVSNKSIISIKNLDHLKRPISAVADSIEFKNIKDLSIKANKKIKIVLLHDKSKSLFNKIRSEQLKKKK